MKAYLSQRDFTYNKSSDMFRGPSKCLTWHVANFCTGFRADTWNVKHSFSFIA